MSEPLHVLGGDPGKHGAICHRFPGGLLAYQWDVFRMPELRGFRLYGFMEQVGSRPDDDPYTAFQFGKQTGMMESYMRLRSESLEFVPPQTWQLEFGLGGKYPSYDHRKRAHKAKAQEIVDALPNAIPTRLTLITCDAILIAEYGYRKTNGELTHGKDQNRILRPGTGLKRIFRDVE